MKRIFTLLMLAFCLSACCFHLRGLIDIPAWLNNISIISKDGNKELVSILKAQFEAYKIKVNPDPASAKYWLFINNTNLQRQIVSIGSSTNPRQYQLILTIEYMLQERKGPIVQTAKLITVNRQMTVNNDRILGSNDEETVLIGEMKKDAAIQIINRLSINK